MIVPAELHASGLSATLGGPLVRPPTPLTPGAGQGKTSRDPPFGGHAFTGREATGPRTGSEAKRNLEHLLRPCPSSGGRITEGGAMPVQWTRGVGSHSRADVFGFVLNFETCLLSLAARGSQARPAWERSRDVFNTTRVGGLPKAKPAPLR
jgi:hypothetical protein